MGTSKKGHKVAKTEKGKSVKLRNLAKRELDGRQAKAVRGGMTFIKVLDKTSAVL